MSEPTLEIPPSDPNSKGSKGGKGSGPGDASEPNQTLIMPQGSTGGLGLPGAPGQDEAILEAWFKTFHSYEVMKKLGEGGMGSVYKARQKNLNRTVALKVLPQRLSADKRYTARLLREAQVLAKINHPNVITCYDVGEHEKLLFVVMEFVEGESLYDLIKHREKLPVEEALSYLKQAVLGLDHANAVGVIHRDIKPENLLLSTARPQGSTIRSNPFNTLKIADLGLAAYTDENQQNTRLTVEGSALGSPYYMSPEQTLGEKNLDTRTDIYALGITLYQMVTGKTPYEAQSIGAILAKKLSETIPDPRSVRPELPAGLSLLIQRMTARKKEDRYVSYGDLLRDIEALEQQKPLAAEVLPEERGSVFLLPETLAKLGRPMPKVGRSKSEADPARGGIGAQPPAGKFSGVMIAGAVVGVLFLFLALFFVSGSKPKPAAPVVTGPATSPPSIVQGPAIVQQPAIVPQPAIAPPKNPHVTIAPPVRTATTFELKALIDNKSTQGWASTGEKHIFGFEPEDDALSLQSPTKNWSHAERELPGPEYKLTGSLKIVRGADECEVQVGMGGKVYAALGIRFPIEAKGKVIAYVEKRETATNKVIKVENSEVGLDPDAWCDVRIQCWDGQAACFINDNPFGSVELDAPEQKSGTVRLAVRNGIGLFRNLWVLPRPAKAEKP